MTAREFLSNAFRYQLNKNKGFPINLMFAVTAKCNLKCKHCFYWKNLNKKSDELTLEEIEKISKNMGHLHNLSFSGGEPFLREDIVDIAKIFIKNNSLDVITITTNGTLLDIVPQKAEQIAKALYPKQLSMFVSFDGLKKVHDFVRGVPGTFKKAEIMINKLIEMRDTKCKNMKVFVLTDVNNYTCDHLLEVAKYVKKNFKVDHHNFDVVRGKPKSASLTVPSKEKLDIAKKNVKTVYSWYNKKFSLKRLYKNFLFDLQMETEKQQRQIQSCLLGTSAVLSETGDIRLCELIEPLGNLRDVNYDIKAFWNSEKAKKQKEKYKDCYCSHCCHQNYNFFLRPLKYYKLLKEF